LSLRRRRDNYTFRSPQQRTKNIVIVAGEMLLSLSRPHDSNETPLDIASPAIIVDVRRRIASPGMRVEAELLPHLICSPSVVGGGDFDEADKHGSAR
jgi:hypothetical protein